MTYDSILMEVGESIDDPAMETLVEILLIVYDTTEGVERTQRLNEVADDLAHVFDAPQPQARIYIHGMAKTIERALWKANRLPVALGGDTRRRPPLPSPAGVHVRGHVRRQR